MANQKISELTAATSIAGADLIPVVQGGVTKKAAVSLLPSGGAAVSRNPHPQSHNLKGWNFDPLVAGAGATQLAADTLYLVKIPTPDSISVSNVHFVIGTTATTDVAGFYAAIIGPDGAVLGQSADQAALVNAAAVNTAVAVPLASAASITGGGPTGFVYAAIGYDAATTHPNVVASAGAASQLAAINVGLPVGQRRHGTLANATWPLTGPFNLTSMAQATTPKNPWMAIS